MCNMHTKKHPDARVRFKARCSRYRPSVMSVLAPHSPYMATALRSARTGRRRGYLVALLTASAALRVFVLISAANCFWSGVSVGAKARESTKKTSATVTADFHSYGSLIPSNRPARLLPVGALLSLRLTCKTGDAIKTLVPVSVIISLNVWFRFPSSNVKEDAIGAVAQRPAEAYFSASL